MSQQEIKLPKSATQAFRFDDLEIGDWFFPHDRSPELWDEPFAFFLKVGTGSAMRFLRDKPNVLLAAGENFWCVRCFPTITVPTL